jgi:hypothetical protein
MCNKLKNAIVNYAMTFKDTVLANPNLLKLYILKNHPLGREVVLQVTDKVSKKKKKLVFVLTKKNRHRRGHPMIFLGLVTKEDGRKAVSDITANEHIMELVLAKSGITFVVNDISGFSKPGDKPYKIPSRPVKFSGGKRKKRTTKRPKTKKKTKKRPKPKKH